MIEQLYKKYQESGFNVSTDSRNIEKGSLFFALNGPNFNANKYAKQAIEKGANFAVIDNSAYSIAGKTILVNNSLKALQELALFHRNQFSIPIIGITGSNGKTTSKELIGAVLKSTFKTLITQGNFNNHIGVPLTLLRLRPHHQIAIIEMGANHIGEIKELSKIANPNYGIITNIGVAHIEGFGSIEGVKKTKKELYDYISENNGTIFCNEDDSVLKGIIPNNTLNAFYGKKSKTIKGEIINLDPFINFKWCSKDYQSEALTTNLIGEYNFYNFLLAISVGHHFKVEPKKISDSLSSYQPTNNRSQVEKTTHNTVIVDCYNANPTSTLAALESFNRVEKANKMVILGDMLELGDISFNEHQKIIDYLTKNNINGFTVGQEFEKVAANFKNFKTVELLMDFLSSNPIQKNSFLLIKGSRGIQLEKLISSKTI